MTPRIAILDDEPRMVDILSMVLRREGYDVRAFNDPETALAEIEKHPVDCLLTDLKMPGMDGLEAARIINGEKICGVLMLTAFSQREVVEQARDAGALAFLVKPFQKSDLIPAIEVAMGRFRELRSLTGEIDALGEQLESRKIIDRAKGVLIDESGMSENDAFAFIQRTAMSERTRMRDVADRVLDGSLRPGTD